MPYDRFERFKEISATELETLIAKAIGEKVGFDVSASIKALDYQPTDVAGADTVAVSLTFRASQSIWEYMTTREGSEELAKEMGLFRPTAASNTQ